MMESALSQEPIDESVVESFALKEKTSLESEEVGFDLVGGGIVPLRPKRRRRKRRKPIGRDCEEQQGNNETSDEKGNDSFTPIHRPFHRIVFDEDGNASEVIPRSNNEYQVNRKHQKRLATSNYNWTWGGQRDNDGIKVAPMKHKCSEFSSHMDGHQLGLKNLQVRIHRFPNDYETVVKYWYTTLEWLDKGAATSMEQAPDGGEGEEETYSTDKNEKYENCTPEKSQVHLSDEQGTSENPNYSNIQLKLENNENTYLEITKNEKAVSENRSNDLDRKSLDTAR